MPAALWWIRRDLRVDENPALQCALAAGYSVVPVFILDPHLLEKAGPSRAAFLFQGLKQLDLTLRREHGARLVIKQGNPADELAGLFNEVGAAQIFAGDDYSPYARQRDRIVAERLPLQLVTEATIHPPAAVTKADGSPYKVFSAFSRAWNALPFPGKPAPDLPPVFVPLSEVISLPIPEGEKNPFFPAGEIEANRRLQAFMTGTILNYAAGRDRLDHNGTSCLSPYLRFGMLSIRRAAWEAKVRSGSHEFESPTGPQAWLNELVWREFYASILYHFPQVMRQAFNPGLRNVPWRVDTPGLRAWQNGLTGYPVVDACMRQLLEMGWMSNRGRMITASFLTKDLLINWQEGERWFMDHLVDGDPAANNGGWQWTAGVGTDAAPYFRILNPVSQSKKCDPDGRFIRRWVPELARLPGEFIHEPWLMPEEVQRAARCLIGKDYPAPIVDHRMAKERTIKAYKEASANYIHAADKI